MSQFIRPKFKQTITLEATLVRADVEAYAQANEMSFTQACQVLAKEYIVHHYTKAIVWTDGVSTPPQVLDDDDGDDDGDDDDNDDDNDEIVDFCGYCSAHTYDGYCSNCGAL